MLVRFTLLRIPMEMVGEDGRSWSVEAEHPDGAVIVSSVGRALSSGRAVLEVVFEQPAYVEVQPGLAVTREGAEALGV